jgi:hypothetical protein
MTKERRAMCLLCAWSGGKCGEPQPSDQAGGSEKMAPSEPEVGKRGRCHRSWVCAVLNQEVASRGACVGFWLGLGLCIGDAYMLDRDFGLGFTKRWD